MGLVTEILAPADIMVQRKGRQYVIERATLDDIDELLKLYFSIYGSNYPLAIGTDRSAMAEAMQCPHHTWLVTRDTGENIIVGSVVFAVDPVNRIGKVSALVVHAEYRGRSISQDLISYGTDRLLTGLQAVNSVYTTTRTNSVGPQLIFLRAGFLPLGLFPNAHKLKDYESLTLFAKFRKGVLENRVPLQVTPEKLWPLIQVLNQNLALAHTPGLVATKRGYFPTAADIPELEFELIFAPHYVKKRFYETFHNPYDRFYPFHTPNLFLASTKGALEVYAFLSKVDHYCTIVSLTKPVHTLAGRMHGLLNALKEAGASYIEILVGLEQISSIEALLDAQFLPSAIYPAMQERNGRFHDFVLMSRTMEPLNFKGMEIAGAFKPYVDQYVDLWKKMHLDTLEIFNEYK